jgi:dihydroorotase
MTCLIKNAQMIQGEIAHIFIKNGLIYDIGPRLTFADAQFDAKGKLAMPGVIDPHVHFRVPGSPHKEDWITGSRAAVSGGITTVFDMPNNNPAITTSALLSKKMQIVSGTSYVNYGFYIGATKDNLTELQEAQGAIGIKVYLGSSTGGLLMDDYAIFEKILKETTLLVACHAEDEACLKRESALVNHPGSTFSPSESHNSLRPEKCARIAVEKAAAIASRLKKPVYFCHISGKEELVAIANAREKGAKIYTEATPHHLFLSTEETKEAGGYAQVNPPIRSSKSTTYLQKALISKEIDTIGTDHAPHTKAEKEGECGSVPSGMPGVETALPLMLNHYNEGRISLKRISELMAENPARIFKLKNRGLLAPGYFADIVLVDLDLTKKVQNSTLYSKCGWSLFSGRKLTGWPYATFVNGNLCYEEGNIIGTAKGVEVAML